MLRSNHPHNHQLEHTHWKHNQKGNSIRVFIQRNLQHCPQRTKDVYYTGLLRSLLGYASTVWDPFTYVNIQQLESVQRRSARFAMNNYRYSSSVTSMMLNTLQWQLLSGRRTTCTAVMMYIIVNDLAAKPPLELHTTSPTARGHTVRFLVQYARISSYRHFFFPDSIRICDSLPQPLVDITPKCFQAGGTEQQNPIIAPS
jgi:hypothetical protein